MRDEESQLGDGPAQGWRLSGWPDCDRDGARLGPHVTGGPAERLPDIKGDAGPTPGRDIHTREVSDEWWVLVSE
jgi:hypothetical protein